MHLVYTAFVKDSKKKKKKSRHKTEWLSTPKLLHLATETLAAI